MPGKEPLFHYKWELTAHTEALHPEISQSHECALCGQVFADKVLLDAHNITCTLACDTCGETFVDKASFDTHTSTCTLTCEGCGNNFGNKTLLKEHVCTSSCDGCGETFELATALQTHHDSCIQYLGKVLAVEREERAAEQRGRVAERKKLLMNVMNLRLAMVESKKQQVATIGVQMEESRGQIGDIKAELSRL
ncbi:hypothetical protein G6011_09185 [Alternaria panax]|uniref:C2H2-type domain-containing protein n=1 Tax=Alternaria panax TaxID=48097 RepID=A0AAD4IAL1_9PLEO|nr:hypothetical protein G6011_09185 [Alternaria panax]